MNPLTRRTFWPTVDLVLIVKQVLVGSSRVMQEMFRVLAAK